MKEFIRVVVITLLILAVGVGVPVYLTRDMNPHYQQVETKTTNNPSVPVETLFTDPEGYTVHRFVDEGYNHYYVTPTGSVTKDWTEPQGKVIVHKQETIQTVPAKGNR